MVDAELMRLARMLSEVAELAKLPYLSIRISDDSEFAYTVTYWDGEGNLHTLSGARNG